MSELCKLWLVNQIVVSPRCEREVGLAIKGHQEGALCGGNAVSLDSVSVSIWVTRFHCYQTVPVGGTCQGCVQSPCAISYNCTEIYEALQIKSSLRNYHSSLQT